MTWPSEKGPKLKIRTRIYVPFTYISYLVYIFNDKKDDDQCLPGLTQTVALRPSRVTSPLNVLTSGVIDGYYWNYDVRHGGTYWSYDIYVTLNMWLLACASTLLTCKSNVNYDMFRGTAYTGSRTATETWRFTATTHCIIYLIILHILNILYSNVLRYILYITEDIRKFTYFTYIENGLTVVCVCTDGSEIHRYNPFYS